MQLCYVICQYNNANHSTTMIVAPNKLISVARFARSDKFITIFDALVDANLLDRALELENKAIRAPQSKGTDKAQL